MPEQDQKSSTKSPGTPVRRTIKPSTEISAVTVKRVSTVFGPEMPKTSEMSWIASKLTESEAEALTLVATFDGRLTEAEKRIDRVLARLDVE